MPRPLTPPALHLERRHPLEDLSGFCNHRHEKETFQVSVRSVALSSSGGAS